MKKTLALITALLSITTAFASHTTTCYDGIGSKIEISGTDQFVTARTPGREQYAERARIVITGPAVKHLGWYGDTTQSTISGFIYNHDTFMVDKRHMRSSQFFMARRFGNALRLTHGNSRHEAWVFQYCQ